MVSRRTNFGERNEPAPDRGGKLQSAGGGVAQSNVSPLKRSLHRPETNGEMEDKLKVLWDSGLNSILSLSWHGWSSAEDYKEF